jgi:hypothetical protein
MLSQKMLLTSKVTLKSASNSNHLSNELRICNTSSDPKKGALVLRIFFRILKFWENAMLSISLKGKIRLNFFPGFGGLLKKSILI